MTPTHNSSRRHSRLPLGCLLSAASLACLCAVASPVAGQVAPAPAPARPAAVIPGPRPPRGPTILDAIKRLPGRPAGNALANYIRAEAALLSHPEPQWQRAGRQALEAGAHTANAPEASAEYQAAYAEELNRHLLPLLKNPDLRVRLNAAVAMGRAAARMPNNAAGLAPSAMAAVGDKAEPVVLWGVKTARYALPALLDAPTGKPNLPGAVVQAVTRFPLSAPLAEDAYDALAGDAIRGAAAPAGRKLAAVPHLVSLLNARVAVFQKANLGNVDDDGNLIMPGSPTIDNAAPLYFSTVAWTTPRVTPAQKQQMVGAMLGMAREMARLFPDLPSRAEVQGTGTTKEDAAAALKQIGSAASVMFTREGKADLKKSAETVAQVTAVVPPATVEARVQELEAAFGAAGLLPAGGGGGGAPAPAAPAAGGPDAGATAARSPSRR